MRGITLLSMLFAASVAACSPGGTSVDRPIVDVQNSLYAVVVPRAVTISFVMYGGVAAERKEGPGLVSWIVRQDGVELGTYEVTFEANGADKTIVTKRFTPGQPAKPKGDHIDATSLVSDAFTAVMDATVDRAATGAKLDKAESDALLRKYGDNHPEEKQALMQRIANDMRSRIR